MTDKLTPKYELTIGGSVAPPELIRSLISIVVRLDNDFSDAIEVRLNNADLEWSDGDTVAEGTKIAVKLGHLETDSFDTLASGTVTRRECEFPERGPSTLVAIAYDAKSMLKRGKKSKTWTQVKHSDVVSQICQANGIQADVDDTGDPQPYLFQIAQNDLTFIKGLAGLNGFEVRIDPDGSKLSFKKPTTGEAADTTLKWGESLLSFRPRFSIHGQSQKTSVRGWDPSQKQAILGKASTSDLQSSMSSQHVGADVAKAAFGDREHPTTAQPVSSQDQADRLAKAQINASMQNFAEAEGSCQGAPLVVPGSVLEVQNVGARASGLYYVTSALHCYESRGYTTYFRLKRPGSGTPPAPPPVPPSPPPAPPASAPSKVFKTQVRSRAAADPDAGDSGSAAGASAAAQASPSASAEASGSAAASPSASADASPSASADASPSASADASPSASADASPSASADASPSASADASPSASADASGSSDSSSSGSSDSSSSSSSDSSSSSSSDSSSSSSSDSSSSSSSDSSSSSSSDSSSTSTDNPVVQSIDPATGPTAGATAVTVTGTGFTGATGATIGGNPLDSFAVTSDTEITGNTPAGTAGAADVVVQGASTASDPSAGGSGMFTYGGTGDLLVVLQMDLATAQGFQDQLTLTSDDGSFTQSLVIATGSAQDADPSDGNIEFKFTGLDTTKTYTLTITPPSGLVISAAPITLFQSVAYSDLVDTSGSGGSGNGGSSS